MIFFAGEGFVGLTRSFGWPQVKTWFVWQAHMSPAIREATFATREILVTPGHVSLAELRKRESEEAFARRRERWCTCRYFGFRTHKLDADSLSTMEASRSHTVPQDGIQAYKIGHLSLPKSD